MRKKQGFRFSLIISPLRGERLVVFYLMAIVASVAIGIYTFNKTTVKPYEWKQSKLEKMQIIYKEKVRKSIDYASLQAELDTAMGNQHSCLTTLKKETQNPTAQQTAQWQECISKESVTKRLIKFNEDNKSHLMVFEKPEAVLEALASSTRDLNLENVFYNMAILKDSDFSDLLLSININIPENKLPEYIERLSKDCASCLTRLSSLSYTNEQKIVNANLKITIYLSPENYRQAIKKWQQTISDGKLSGNNLENYNKEQTMDSPS
ncbi:MAG: hypothetical protein KAT25_05675 [Sulfuriflexus sp.]|nr:hypothetical protein [Sulfuriflexus sp.]